VSTSRTVIVIISAAGGGWRAVVGDADSRPDRTASPGLFQIKIQSGIDCLPLWETPGPGSKSEFGRASRRRAEVGEVRSVASSTVLLPMRASIERVFTSFDRDGDGFRRRAGGEKLSVHTNRDGIAATALGFRRVSR